MADLSKKEQKRLKEIESKYYFTPSQKKLESFISQNGDTPEAWKRSFDQIYNFLTQANEEVQIILNKRKESGEIKDTKQASKSIVGNLFSELLIFIFLKNKEAGNIHEDIFISSRPSQVPEFENFTTIHIGNDTQKPDCDIIIYKLKNQKELEKLLILSLKTSLRERAGQTYKWKLLLEIASSENEIKEKYNIRYDAPKMPTVCFATVNFYNEINQPQHRGMFQFFDKSFIAKDIETEDFISNLSALVDYLQEEF